MKTKTRVFAAIRLAVAGTVCLAAGGAGMVIYGHTLVAWWQPVAAAALTALLTLPAGAARWHIVTGTTGRAANALFHLCAVGAVAYFALLAGNYATADKASAVEEKAVVTRKYRKQHTRYRRTGRHRTRTDGTYDTFHLTVAFDGGGREKELTVTRQEYNRVRTGAARTFIVQKGGLGFAVIKQAKTTGTKAGGHRAAGNKRER